MPTGPPLLFTASWINASYKICCLFASQYSSQPKSPVKEILIVCRSEKNANELEKSGYIVKNKIKNEITLEIENKSITSSLKSILNNYDIEDLYINEPPVDEIIGKILVKDEYNL